MSQCGSRLESTDSVSFSSRAVRKVRAHWKLWSVSADHLLNKEPRTVPGLTINSVPELLHPPLRLFALHRDGLRHALCTPGRVPWIHHQAALQRRRRPGKFGEHQDTRRRLLDILAIVASDVFVAYEVQPISGAADETHVRGGVERGQLVRLQGLVEEVDGDVVEAACSIRQTSQTWRHR